MKPFLPFFSFILIAIGVSAQPGVPDPGFGVNGQSLVNFYNWNMTGEGVSKVVIQPDGKLLFAGSISGSSGFLYRFKSSAPAPWQYLDSSFGNNGVVYLHGMTIACARLQGDGKIVVAGNHPNGTNNDLAVARFNSDGTMDMGFGNGGKVYSAIGTGNDMLESVAIQADGKIVAGGYSSGSSATDFVVVRYHADGTPDNTFDGDGVVLTDFGSGTLDVINDIAIQADGKIVATGYSGVFYPTSNYFFAAARYNSDGTPDNSFDGDGRTTTDIGSGNDRGLEMALQPDGKIVVAGASHNGTNDDFALVRYLTNGSLDNSFDGDGKVVTAIGTGDELALAIAILSDGKILAGGSSYTGSNVDMALARYTAAGILDNSFDGDGKLTYTLEPDAFAQANEAISSLAIQADGKIVVAGFNNNGVAGNSDLVNARFSSNGVIDAGFSNAISIVGGTREYVQDMVVQADGKLVLAGYVNEGSGNKFGVVRYLPNGDIDTNFGTDGKVVTDIAINEDLVKAVALQGDGKIVVAGTGRTITGNTDFAVARYLANGTPDNSFDGDGKLLTFLGSEDDGVNAVVVQPDGKIVAAGFGHNGVNSDFALVRYLTDGTPDASFGTGGKVLTNITPMYEYIHAMGLQPDGKIVVAGTAQGDFALARYLPNGMLDGGFGSGGIVLTPIGSSADNAYALVIQPNGYILAAGNSYIGANSVIGVVRYKPDGSLDTGFGIGGKVTINPGNALNEAVSIGLQDDLKIIVGGTTYTGTQGDIVVARLLPDGTPDASFDGDGMAIIDMMGNSDVAGAMKLYGNRIYIAATSTSHQLEDFALLSLQNDAVALPLSLRSFRGQVKGDDVLLEWRTASEQNTAAFHIERRVDGINFQTIGTVEAAGTSMLVQEYSFTDVAPSAGMNYYRLKVVDLDGRISYSGIVTIRLANDGAAGLMAFPNPVQQVLQVRFNAVEHDKVNLQIIDGAGRVVRTGQYVSTGSTLSIPVDVRGLGAGSYTLVVTGKKGRVVKQFIKR